MGEVSGIPAIHWFNEVIKSKDEVVLHAGFRRFSARPIYSEIPRRTKHTCNLYNKTPETNLHRVVCVWRRKSSTNKKYKFTRFLHQEASSRKCIAFKFPCKPSVVICAWRKGTALHQHVKVYALQNLLTSLCFQVTACASFYAPVVGNSARGSWQPHGKKKQMVPKNRIANLPRFSHPVGCWCLCSLKEKGLPRDPSLAYPPWKDHISIPRHFWVNDTVDGWNPVNRLRLVVYPHDLQGYIITQVVVLDFSHQQYFIFQGGICFLVPPGGYRGGPWQFNPFTLRCPRR